MEMERWAPIADFEGIYEISTHGRVRRGARYLRTFPVNGYPTVTLCGDGFRRRTTVHILVAETFIGPRPEGDEDWQVSHEDGNRANPNLSNLKYRTRQDNMSMMRQHGTALIGERAPTGVLTASEVLEIRRRYVPWCSVNGQKPLGEEFGCSARNIRNIVRRLIWTHI